MRPEHSVRRLRTIPNLNKVEALSFKLDGQILAPARHGFHVEGTKLHDRRANAGGTGQVHGTHRAMIHTTTLPPLKHLSNPGFLA